jgi:hypothetical protein
MTGWRKQSYRPIVGPTLIDPLALAIDELGVGVTNTLCALGLSPASAELVVSAGHEAMIRTYEALQRAAELNDARTAEHLRREGLTDER